MSKSSDDAFGCFVPVICVGILLALVFKIWFIMVPIVIAFMIFACLVGAIEGGSKRR